MLAIHDDNDSFDREREKKYGKTDEGKLRNIEQWWKKERKKSWIKSYCHFVILSCSWEEDRNKKGRE
jgi:hypothetical protein